MSVAYVAYFTITNNNKLDTGRTFFVFVFLFECIVCMYNSLVKLWRGIDTGIHAG